MANGTYNELATYLTNGYWTDTDRSARSFDHTEITYNVTGLQPADQELVRQATDLWADVSGLTFTPTTGTADITYDDASGGAGNNSSVSGNTIRSSHVNISPTWGEGVGAGLNSERFQTFIHETGHALGLGHQGHYNGSASYSEDATFDNDSWQLSVMSYFDQTANTKTVGSFARVLTPQIVDIIAIQDLYEDDGNTTRLGNTTYGVDNNTGRESYGADFTNFPSVTIYDQGGIDTLNYSGTSHNQQINLAEQSMSSVYGETYNITIARDTVIENAISGSGDDILRGNSANNHLSGNAGNDRMYGRTGNDTIYGNTGQDFMYGDDGNDDLYGGDGNDTVNGGAGNDFVNGGSGNDSLYGGYGHDSLYGGSGDDRIFGSTGNDFIYGDTGNDTLDGGDGNDTVNGGAGNDIVNGGSGNDSLYGVYGHDRLYGGDGNDRLYGVTGNDFIHGGSGKDVLTGGSGADTFFFAKGDSGFSYDLSNADIITDFKNWEGDKIDLSLTNVSFFGGEGGYPGANGGYPGANEVNYRHSDYDNDGDKDTIVSFNDGGVHDIVLHNVIELTMYSTDFIL